MKITLLLLLCQLTLCTRAFAAEPSPTLRDSLVNDFTYLVDILEKTHPDPYTGFGGRYFFKAEANRIKNLLQEKDASQAEFASMVSVFMANIRDMHTFINNRWAAPSQESLRLPLRFRIYSDGIIVSEAPEGSGLTGSRVMAVNGIEMEALLARMATLRACENTYGAYLYLNNWLTMGRTLKQLLPDSSEEIAFTFALPDGSTRTERFTLLTKNALDKVKMTATPVTPTIDESGNISFGFADQGKNLMYLRFHSVMARENYRVTIESKWPNAPEQLRQYYHNVLNKEMPEDINEALQGIPSFSETFAAMLTQMKANGSDVLIIDLRGNGGGWTPITLPTLYMMYGDEYLTKDMETNFSRMVSELYLKKTNSTLDQFRKHYGESLDMGDFIFNSPVDQPKDIATRRQEFITSSMSETKDLLTGLQGKPLYRPAKVYVLTDVNTFSAAFHYAFYLWKMGAEVVGVPCAQAPNTFMETTEFQLPNTKITGSISNSIQIFLPANDPRAKVFYPDLIPTYDDYKHYHFDENTEVLYLLDKVK